MPFIPRAGSRLYAFGTQPIWERYRRAQGLQENAPIGYRWSDDDGHAWSDVRPFEPDNDPGFTGMSVMRMCETETGSWLIGSHEADWSHRPLLTRQYILRTEDEGASWQLLPDARDGGWFASGFGRLDEGRPIDLGGGEALLMARSPEGHLWQARSMDDGRNWSYPAPTQLVHPDAPPMLFKLSDGATLAAFHHNRHHDLDYTGLDGTKPELMADRSELWVSLSSDGGRSWSEPRFLLANALEPTFDTPFRNHQCSYVEGVRGAEAAGLGDYLQPVPRVRRVPAPAARTVPPLRPAPGGRFPSVAGKRKRCRRRSTAGPAGASPPPRADRRRGSR